MFVAPSFLFITILARRAEFGNSPSVCAARFSQFFRLSCHAAHRATPAPLWCYTIAAYIIEALISRLKIAPNILRKNVGES